MDLKQFLHTNNISLRAFARSVGMKLTQVENAVYKRSATLATALRIQKATHGHVMPIDLLKKEKVEKYQLDSLFDEPKRRR